MVPTLTTQKEFLITSDDIALAAQLARTCSSLAARERTLVSHAVLAAIRRYFDSSERPTQSGRCADTRFADLLDVTDFTIRDWRVDLRVLSGPDPVALYVPTMPLMVGAMADYYVCVQVDGALSKAVVHGVAGRHAVADGDVSANGLFVVVDIDELQAFDELHALTEFPPLESQGRDEEFDAWRDRADRISHGLAALIANDGTFSAQEAERLATGLRDNILRIYGEHLPATGLEALFRKLFRRFGIRAPLPTKPGSALVFDTPGENSLETGFERAMLDNVRNKLDVMGRVDLYRRLLHDDAAFDQYWNLRSGIDAATAGKAFASPRRKARQESARRDPEYVEGRDESRPVYGGSYSNDIEPDSDSAIAAHTDIAIEPSDDGSFLGLSLPAAMDTSSHDLVKDFFDPVLARARQYDRGVGYFSSGWFRLASHGMAEFASNGGRARWITSPILSQIDWEALETGDAARSDESLRETLGRNINDLQNALESETLGALAWMVADEVISIRLAVPRNRLDGDFHDKFGVFTDTHGNRLSFNGSYNDSIRGSRNYESIKVFSSLNSSVSPFVEADQRRFERLWTDMDPNVRVFDLPTAARDQLLELRPSERPYPEPAWITARRHAERVRVPGLPTPAIPPALVLRDYQITAIDQWFQAGRRGLLEMATGTGKTITALALATHVYSTEGRLALVVTVPYQHLVDQWDMEARRFGFRPILAYKSKRQWQPEFEQQISDFLGRRRDVIAVIVTHTTFVDASFQKCLSKLSTNTLLIADEVHHLGAGRGRESYPSQITDRLALSATPDRWFDEEGTHALRAYFGETVYSLPLAAAIGEFLTPYSYHPHLVALTEGELEEYGDLSIRIAQVLGQDDPDAREILRLLLIKRANLLNCAEGKIPALARLVDEQTSHGFTLYYCAPGQIDAVTRLLGWEKRLRVARFTAEETTSERKRILADFANGTLDGLVAMKCLDEGVDVPATRMAYILASSGNPREFIQRRGRVLRKAEGKTRAVIHDLIAVPPVIQPTKHDIGLYKAERSVLRRELRRFREFANAAENKHEALDAIWHLAKHYNLMDL